MDYLIELAKDLAIPLYALTLGIGLIIGFEFTGNNYKKNKKNQKDQDK